MWWNAIDKVLAPGIGVAISPTAIAAVLLFLSGPSGLRRGGAFVAGFATSLAALSLIVLAATSGHDSSSRHTLARVTAVIQLAFAVVLAVAAVILWVRRPPREQTVDTPAWLRAVDGARARTAFQLGLVIAVVNVKNLPLSVTAATDVAAVGASAAASVVAILIFVAIGCIGVGIPLTLVRFGPPGVEAGLARAKQYLIRHNSLILAALFAVLALIYLLQSIATLRS